MKTVLVVDDEADIRELVRYNLEREGYRVREAADGESALREIEESAPAMVVLDLMLPGIDGLEVLRRVRAGQTTKALPVLLLTAKGSETDRVVGLELGADDYLVKPFSPRELVARIRTILRRVAASGGSMQREVLKGGPIEIDTGRRAVSVTGRAVRLTTTEFNLLLFLASRPGRAFTRNELIDGAIGTDAVVTDRTIDAHVAAIRRKLGQEAAQWIETIRGYGYRFREG